MNELRAEFKSYCRGREKLRRWKRSLEVDFENGEQINKTKYQKICRLYEDREKKARELLDKLNQSHPWYVECMPPLFPPPPPPSPIERIREDR